MCRKNSSTVAFSPLCRRSSGRITDVSKYRLGLPSRGGSPTATKNSNSAFRCSATRELAGSTWAYACTSGAREVSDGSLCARLPHGLARLGHVLLGNRENFGWSVTGFQTRRSRLEPLRTSAKLDLYGGLFRCRVESAAARQGHFDSSGFTSSLRLDSLVFLRFRHLVSSLRL